jgi:hypothetical protein
MSSALGLTTRPVNTVSDSVEKHLWSAKSGSKVNAIKIPRSRIWTMKCKKNVSHTQRINTNANSRFHYFQQRNNFKLVHTFFFCKLVTKSVAVNKTIYYTNKIFIYNCYMFRPLMFRNKQQCVKGWWRTLTILILIKKILSSQINFIAHISALKPSNA